MERPFEILQGPSGPAVAVKRGFSWPAFFLSWIWAFACRLWVPGVLLLLVEAALGYFVVAVLQGNPVAAIAFSLVFSCLVGRTANLWRSEQLQANGVSHRGIIYARSPAAALTAYNQAGKVVTSDLSVPRGGTLLTVPRVVQPLGAVILLTIKSAVRYRLIPIVGALLLVVVVGLPMVIKDDGSARGMTQILITYTLTAVTALLGFISLWLACGTLARDIEDCQMQMVTAKPMPRWQIWVGKWIGIMVLNAVLLTGCGLAIYTMLHWRASQLSQVEQEALHNEVLVSRDSVKEPPADLEGEVDNVFRERLKDDRVKQMDPNFVRREIRKEVKGRMEVVPPEYRRIWEIYLGNDTSKLKGKPLYVRIKFQNAQRINEKVFRTILQVGPVDSPKIRTLDLNLAANTFHEIPVPPDLFDDNGMLRIEYWNKNPVGILFPMEDGMEALYYEGPFGLNFLRGLGIIFLWLGLLTALGLAAASYLSFPVAAFFSLSMLVVVFSTGTMSSVVHEGSVEGPDHEGRPTAPTAKDYVLVPAFAATLKLLNLVQQFSPVDALSSGRSVSWTQLARATVQIWVLVGGAVAGLGMLLFQRRELATAQSQQ
jgi:hypothetical protein